MTFSVGDWRHVPRGSAGSWTASEIWPRLNHLLFDVAGTGSFPNHLPLECWSRFPHFTSCEKDAPKKSIYEHLWSLHYEKNHSDSWSQNFSLSQSVENPGSFFSPSAIVGVIPKNMLESYQWGTNTIFSIPKSKTFLVKISDMGLHISLVWSFAQFNILNGVHRTKCSDWADTDK